MGTIPLAQPPAYLDQYAKTTQAGADNQTKLTTGLLDARADALGHVLGNIKNIAAVGGGNIAPDKLLGAYAGSDQPIFTNEYAESMDRLRQAEQQARIGSLSRANRGGSGGGAKTNDTGLQDDQILLRHPDGSMRVINKGLEDAARIQELIDGGWEIANMGASYTPQYGPAENRIGASGETYEFYTDVNTGMEYVRNPDTGQLEPFAGG